MKPDRWERVKDLYHGASERQPGERAAFLAEACADDDDLRREVQVLLDQPVSTEGFVEFFGGLQPELAARLGDSTGVPLTGYRMGAYEVRGLLGRGGMGEVYRAHDSRLGRDVAIKVLPRAFTSDPDRLARFQDEARMLAALNHPHIGAIYGLEEGPAEAGAAFALVLELVEGETLAERIARALVPIPDVLRIARQIAEALEAAHRKGIIHRDLKPANIKITPDGVVKVLDFGLAKIAGRDASGSDVAFSHSPTVPIGRTSTGVIFGTAAYMSPEQARGSESVDQRSDIWAFGCVLYEMLSGRAPFARETLTDTLAAIANQEPDWTALPGTMPPAVGRLLRQCLHKDPEQRLGDIGEARLELERLVVARPPTHRAAALIVVALVVTAVGVALLYSLTPPVPVTSPAEYTQITNFADAAVAPSLSPDGRMVTFIRGGDAFLSRGQIHVKLLPNGESVRLTSDGSLKYGPVFTPDGSRIAYTRLMTQGTSLLWDTWTVPVLGGEASRFLPNASGLVWLADRRVLFAEIKAGLHMGIVTTTENRADRREIYFPASDRAMAHFAYPSPDRQWILVVEMNGTHHFSLPCRLMPFDGSSAGRQVGPPGTCTSAAWSPDEKWMYFGATVAGSSHLWRQEFPDGRPEQITFGPTEEEGVTVAPDGRSVVTSLGTRRSAIWIHDAAGERALSSEGYARDPRLSRDGTRVFYLLQQNPSSPAELRSADLGSGRAESALPGVSIVDYDISRDDREVAYTTEGDGSSQIWVASLDRRAPPRQIARAADQVSFGADGDLFFRSLEENTNSLVRVRKDGTRRERLTAAPILDKRGVSPDGSWVIVYSPGVGEDDSVTLAVPVDGGAPRRICFPGCRVQWSSDGRFLYVPIGWGPADTAPGGTAVIPVPAGKSLPDLPASGIDSAARKIDLPGTQVIAHGSISPGPDPSTYVFTKSDLQLNLFRIPLH